MKRSGFIVVSAIAMVVGLLVSSAPAAGEPLLTRLHGSNEVPGPGDPDGFGSARVSLNQSQGKVCFNIDVHGVSDATAAHIHQGAPGVAGPVVVALVAPSGGANVQTSAGCVEAPSDTIKAIRQDPSGYYVNVHTTEYPGGALRGNLTFE